MKNITIYATGSCNNSTKYGTYYSCLEFKGHRKYLTSVVHNTTTNRCIIHGIIEAMRIIKEPCNVSVVIAAAIGIKKWNKNRKGANADLFNELHLLAKEKSCLLSFDYRKNKGSLISKLSKESL